MGDLPHSIVAHKTDLAPPTPWKWTREPVAAQIRDINIEQLLCAETYREDASFVQDLGLVRSMPNQNPSWPLQTKAG